MTAPRSDQPSSAFRPGRLQPPPDDPRRPFVPQTNGGSLRTEAPSAAARNPDLGDTPDPVLDPASEIGHERHGTVTDVFAQQVLNMALSIEAQERRIKQELLRAAERRDFERIQYVITRWLTGPVADVLTTVSTSSRNPDSTAFSEGSRRLDFPGT